MTTEHAPYFSRLRDELLKAVSAQQSGAVSDPVPDDVKAAARAAFETRDFDLELALLLFDSAFDRDLVGVRGRSSGSRQLTFGTDSDVTIEVDVDDVGLVGLVGHVVPSDDLTRVAQFETEAGIEPLSVDELGRFFVDKLPAGPFRLRFELADRRVASEWITL